MIKYILFLLLLAGSAWGAQVSLSGGTTRYVASSNDTVTISGTIVSYTGQWFRTASVSNVFIDGQGDTVIFNTEDTSGTNDDNAFPGWSMSTVSNIVCSGLTIIQNSNGGTWNSGVEMYTAKHIRFVDCNMHMKGNNSKGTRMPSGGSGNFMIEIDGGNWTSFVNGFTNRCQNDASIIEFRCQGECADSSLLENYYSLWVHNIVVDSCPHVAINTPGRAIIDSNYFRINAHNDVYSYPSGEVCWSADNAYAIRLSRLLQGSHIFDNDIGVVSSYEGGRGILIEAATGTSTDPILVYNNIIDVSQGPSDYIGGGGTAYGFRGRQDMDDWTPSEHVHIYNNDITVRADDDVATTHIGTSAMGLFFSDADEGNNSSFGDSCLIYNNTVTVYGDSTNMTDGEGEVIAFGTEILGSGRGHKSYNNRFRSNHTVTQFGEFNGGGDGWISLADTIEWYGSDHPYHNYNQTGDTAIMALGNTGGTENCTANVIIDPIFIPSNVTEDEIRNVRSGGDKDITLKATITMTVIGNDDLPIQNALCSLWTGNDTTLVMSGVADENGEVSDTITYFFKSWSGTTPNHTDYNGPGGFVFKAIYSGDSTVVDSTIAWNSKDFVLTLSETGGGAPEPSGFINRRRRITND